MKKLKLNTGPRYMLLLLFLLILSSATRSQGKDKITLVNDRIRLTDVFSIIKKQSGYTVFYNNEILNDKETVRANFKGADLGQVMNQVLSGKELSWVKQNQFIIIKKKEPEKQDKNIAILPSGVISQQLTISGTVIDETNQTLPGVSVKVKNTATGAMTNSDGKYTITVAPNAVLVFSFIGYISQEITVANQKTVNVKLVPETSDLNEVIVVGYGTTRKENLTGAVDQVSGEVFENRPITNIAQGLQGVIPNLNLTPGDGKPTSSPSFNVRGTTSIGQGGSALVLIDGVEGDPSLLNPNDIASVSVLKDAASSAIYGARGAFGVVLITTKNPVKDKISITYSNTFSTKKPTTVPDMVTDGFQWATMFNEAFSAWDNYSTTPQNVNKTLRFSPEYLKELERRSNDPSLPKVDINPNTGEYVYYGSTDWYRELYKDHTSSMEHNLSLSGSSEKASFYLTGRMLNQNGIFRYNSDDYKMYNIRAKGSIQLTPWLTLNNNTDFSNVQYHNPLNVGETGGIWRNMADEAHPLSPLLNPDGSLSHSSAYTVGDFYYGKNGINTNKRQIRSTTGLAASFFENKFRVKSDFTLQYKDDNEERIRVPVPYSRIPGVKEYVGNNYNDLRNTRRETEYVATNIYGEYENTFKGKHYFKAMAGYNYELSTYKRVMAQRNGLIFEDAKDLNLALGQSVLAEGGYERWNVMGGFFRLNYSYDNRYLLEVNGRYDGSSKFPSNERFAFFPSVSAGWRLSEEHFWKVSPDIISNVKLRASYGSLGNGNIASYMFQEQLKIKQSDRILEGTRPQQTSKPEVIPAGLTWETSTTNNYGLDFSLLKGRLSFTGDAYVRKTTDMFTIGMTLPGVFGATPPKGNYADLRTTGWEVSVAWRDQFNISDKPFSYNIQVALSDYKAKILKYNNPERRLNDYYAGQRVGEIWGYETDGFFKSAEDIANSPKQNIFRSSSSGVWLPGDIKFKDLNNDGVIDDGDNTVDSHGDKKIIGNSEARYRFGVNFGAEYSNFFFSAFFQGVGKQDWYPSAESNTFWGQYNRPYGDVPKYQLGNIWSETNPDAYFPRYRSRLASNSQGTLVAKQTRYLQNLAYIRLKSIQFGYNLPKSWLTRVKAGSARIFVSGENLWTYSPFYKLTKDIDIESTGKSDRDLTGDDNFGDGNNYPILKSMTIGLSVTF